MATKRKTTKKKAPVQSAIAKGMAALAKSKVTNQAVPLDESLLRESKPHIPSGSVSLDFLIGGNINSFGVAPCPGWPRGRIVQLYGEPGAGKTTVALTACASVIRLGGTAVYIDWEHEVDAQYAAQIGVPIANADRFALIQPDTLEEGIQYLITMAASGVDLIVLDSVSAGSPQKVFEQKIEDIGEHGRLGEVAATWSKLLPKIKTVISKSGTCLIGISQLRDSINKTGRGPSKKVTGGRAWKYYPALRVYLRVSFKDKTKHYSVLTHKVEELHGNSSQVTAKLEKCKVSSNFNKEGTFWVRSGTGIDDVRTLIEVGSAHKMIKKSGSWYSWVDPVSGEEIRGQGFDKFRDLILETEGAQARLFHQIVPLLSKGYISDEEDDEEDEDDEITSLVKGLSSSDDDDDIDVEALVSDV